MKTLVVALGLALVLIGMIDPGFAMSPLEKWVLTHPGEQIPAWVLFEDSEYEQAKWRQRQQDFEWQQMRDDVDDIRSRLADRPFRYPR